MKFLIEEPKHIPVELPTAERTVATLMRMGATKENAFWAVIRAVDGWPATYRVGSNVITVSKVE